MNWKSISMLFTDTYQAYSHHRVSKMGAALAYYTAFSLAPVIVIILNLASLAVKKDFARHVVLVQIYGLVGHSGTSAVKEILDHTSSPAALSWRTAISFGILLFSASGAFGELRDSLNQIWEVPNPKNFIHHLLKEQLLSIAMILILGIIILLSLVFSVFLLALSKWIDPGISRVGLEAVNTLISTGALAALFGVIFRLLPSVRLTWGDVLPGAILSACLFAIGKIFLGWYLSESTLSTSYGAAGSILIILFWVFYSAQILFIGAEFSRSYTLRFGSMKRIQYSGNFG